MDLDLNILRQDLAGKFIGHPFHYYPEIGSTNDEAFRLGLQGAAEGTAIFADSQNTGKGRMQRVWHSPAGVNIYTSVILSPSFDAARAPQISLAAGVAAAEMMDFYFPNQIHLKWPNDILIGGKKVCGILTQMKTSGSGIDFVVVGIGINVNSRYDQFPEDIRDIATSLSIVSGRTMAREELIIHLYENMAKWYRELAKSGFGAIREKWLSLSPMIGHRVSVGFGVETISGKAVGLGEDGSLMLCTAENGIIKVLAGDATILKRG